LELRFLSNFSKYQMSLGSPLACPEPFDEVYPEPFNSAMLYTQDRLDEGLRYTQDWFIEGSGHEGV
jgi:hypothetical protein